MKKDIIGFIKTQGLEFGIIEPESRAINVKKMYGIPPLLRMISHDLFELEEYPEDISCVAGRGHGGIPLATAISLEQDKRLAMYVSRPKEGTGGKPFEGYVPHEGDTVLIVDDIYLPGKHGGLEKMIEAIEREEAKVGGCYFVAKGGNISGLSVPCKYLIEEKDLF